MSGIVGMMNLDGAPVDRELLSRMTNFMSVRGPDAQNIWIDGNIGLGHTLLRTTWEAESEQQPVTLDGRVWLTADARIDARSELATTLQSKIARSLDTDRSLNDAELILCAYEAWGEECVQHLIGDFAFAIWDSRSQRLFCAHDHLGVKPFFYSHLRDRFIFSNSLNALRVDASVSDALNEVAIADYLISGLNQDLSTTTFRDISRLPPGHTLTVSGNALRVNSYWKPEVTTEIRFTKRQSYVDRFCELLTCATVDRLRTNRVSISMSGGLDSTSVAATTRQLLEGPDVHAYSVVYNHLIPDEERKYSQLAADHLGISVTHIDADRYVLFDGLTTGALDQAEPFLMSPFAGQFNALLSLCSRHARVALTGWDGDALMSEPANISFASDARKLDFRNLISGLAWYVWTQKRLPGFGLRARVTRATSQRAVANSYPKWIDESFAKRTDLHKRTEELSMSHQNSGGRRPSSLKALTSRVWAPLLEGFDAGSTKLPLELRHPFIDRRLIDYLLAIPAVPWCVNKHILRVAMQHRLPAAVVNRPKTPLTGDPALQFARHASVRWLDNFEVSPQLKCFVNLDLRRSIADEQTSEGVWASLRVFALNYWLSNSQPIDRIASGKQHKVHEPVTSKA